jgi:hypothetical protein
MEMKAIKNRRIITYSTSGWSHPVDVLSEEISWGREDGARRKNLPLKKVYPAVYRH